MSGASGLEVERTFLLRAMPVLPERIDSPGRRIERIEIEQGYLPGGDGLLEGRLRRIRHDDGREVFFHTVKRGTGLVREESERELDPAEFAAQWPRTEGRRLRKTRHRVPVGGLVWEVDEFHGLAPVEGRPLVMAEVEIPSGTDPASVPVPAWIAAEIVREVTDDPRFRNYALATGSATI